MLVVLVGVPKILVAELLELVLHKPSLLVRMDIVLDQQRQVLIHGDVLCLDLVQLVLLSRHCVKILRVFSQFCLGLCDDQFLILDL